MSRGVFVDYDILQGRCAILLPNIIIIIVCRYRSSNMASWTKPPSYDQGSCIRNQLN